MVTDISTTRAEVMISELVNSESSVDGINQRFDTIY